MTTLDTVLHIFANLIPLGLAVVLVFTITADLDGGGSFYPAGEPRARLAFALMALALSFLAGVMW